MSIPNSYSSGSIGGSTGATGDVKYKYLGYEQTKNSDNLLTQVTFQGTKEKLAQELASNAAWQIGYWREDFGRLQSTKYNPVDGVFWNVILNFNKPLNLGVPVHSDDNNHPQNSYLDIGLISVPIEKHPDYDYRWNHFLAVTTPYTPPATPLTPIERDWSIVYDLMEKLEEGHLIPPWENKWNEQVADTLINYGAEQNFNASLDMVWLKDRNQMPREKVNFLKSTGQTNPDTGEQIYEPAVAMWAIFEPEYATLDMETLPFKPGIQYYDMPTYTITETGRYTNRNDAKWAIIQGGTLAVPRLGDFGLQLYYHPQLSSATSASIPSCYWRCEGGNIEFDGKYYTATCKYTWSPDPTGWDTQIYTNIFGGWNYYLKETKLNRDPIVRLNTDGSILNPILPIGI